MIKKKRSLVKSLKSISFGYYTIAFNECKKVSARMEIYTGEGVKKY